MRHRIMIGTVLLGVAALVCWAGWLVIEPFVGPGVREYFNRIPFDSVTWKDVENREPGDPVRLRMVDDLLRKQPLVGMSREEIDQLLGPATETSYFAEYDYVYWLGPERSFFSIDSEWLVLKLQQGKVIEAKVVRD